MSFSLQNGIEINSAHKKLASPIWAKSQGHAVASSQRTNTETDLQEGYYICREREPVETRECTQPWYCNSSLTSQLSVEIQVH
jgi:hypothetical protein